MAEKPPTAGSGKRVLIVDDSEIAIQMLEAELEGKGFEVLSADRAEKATELVMKKATRPHLILLDINMPNIDGAQFCRFIKRNAMFSDIKVVLCSGMAQDQLKEVAESCGADGYVSKDMYLGERVSENLE